MDSLLRETRGCLCLAARRAARMITREFDQALRSHGLRSTQFSVLAVLSLRGPKTVGELATFLSAERTTMTRNLAVLESRSLVAVEPGEDARERIVQLTDLGRRSLRSALKDWQRVQRRLTESMGPSAAEGLRAIAWSQAA